MNELRALKPCPFCGGEASYSERRDEDICTHDIVLWRKVSCSECDVSFEWPDDYEGGTAMERWNRRTLTAAEQALSAPPQTDEKALEAAAKEYAKTTGYYVEFHPGLRSESADKIRAGTERAIAAYLSAAPAAVPAWQAMDSAPKDGTAILAANARHQLHAPVVVLWKLEPEDSDVGSEPHWADAATHGGDALYYNGLYFTHWMPLPADPLPSQPAALLRSLGEEGE